MNKQIALAIISGFLAPAPAFAGNLTPPGAPASTMVTLDQLDTAVAGATTAANDATAEAIAAQDPRIDVNALAGDAGAVHVISSPGSYYLSGDVTGISGRSGINILASNVTLDLNGFSVIGVAGAVNGIRFGTLLSSDFSNISLRNGVVRSWPSNGIANAGAFSVTNSRIEDVAIFACAAGLVGWNSSEVTRVTAVQNTLNGIIATNSVVNDCIARNNGTTGLLVSGTISNCLAQSNTGDGFSLLGGVASNCASISNQGDGFNLSGAATLRDSRATQNGLHGIELAVSDSAAIDCEANSNGSLAGTQSGIRVTAPRCVVDGCVATGNSEEGINVNSTGSLVVRNRARNNPTADYVLIGGNSAAQVIAAGAAFVSTDPWANFTF
jgi:hypothetical protein